MEERYEKKSSNATSRVIPNFNAVNIRMRSNIFVIKEQITGQQANRDDQTEIKVGLLEDANMNGLIRNMAMETLHYNPASKTLKIGVWPRAKNYHVRNNGSPPLISKYFSGENKLLDEITTFTSYINKELGNAPTVIEEASLDTALAYWMQNYAVLQFMIENNYQKTGQQTQNLQESHENLVAAIKRMTLKYNMIPNNPNHKILSFLKAVALSTAIIILIAGLAYGGTGLGVGFATVNSVLFNLTIKGLALKYAPLIVGGIVALIADYLIASKSYKCFENRFFKQNSHLLPKEIQPFLKTAGDKDKIENKQNQFADKHEIENKQNQEDLREDSNEEERSEGEGIEGQDGPVPKT